MNKKEMFSFGVLPIAKRQNPCYTVIEDKEREEEKRRSKKEVKKEEGRYSPMKN